MTLKVLLIDYFLLEIVSEGILAPLVSGHQHTPITFLI